MSNVSRQIDERDQWLFNASTNDLVGVKNPTGRGEDFLPVRLSADGTALVSGDGTFYLQQGPSTFDLFGDSISEYVTRKTTVSSLTQSAGLATVAATSHGLNTGYQTIVGASVDAYNGRNYMTAVDRDTLTFAIDSGTASPATGAGVMQPYRRADVNWFDWANFRLGGRMKLVNNFGRGGEAAWEMVSYIEEVKDSASRNVIVELGRNDISQGRSIAQIVDSLTTIIEAFLGYGKTVWVCTIPCVETSHAAYSVRNANREMQVNSWLRRYVQAYPQNGLVLVDVANLLVDPASTGGGARSTYLNATDHVHPTPVGARLAYGEALYQAALYRLPAWNTLPSSVLDAHTLNRQTLTSISQTGGTATATLTAHGYLAGEYVHIYGATPAAYNGLKEILSVPTSATFTFAVDSATATPATGTLFVDASNQLGDNPTLQGTGGAVSGTVTETNDVPDNLTVTETGSGNITTTVVARADGVGNDLVMTFVSAADNDNARVSGATMHNRVAMGETIYLELALDVSSMTNVKAISANLQATVDSIIYISEPWSNMSLGATYFTQTDTGALVVRTPDFEIPLGTAMSALTWNVQVTAAGVGGAVIKVGRVAVRRVLPYMQ